MKQESSMPPEKFPGLRHGNPPLKPILLWDGDCGFCAHSAAQFRRMARGRVADAPVQPLLASLPPEIAATARAQVLFLDTSGVVTGGVRAISAALKAAGRPILGGLLVFPLLYPLFRLGYRLIARLRFLFPAPSACAW
jgi:predicted DCC family thiol-disulfide oxidoreductase YuxK